MAKYKVHACFGMDAERIVEADSEQEALAEVKSELVDEINDLVADYTEFETTRVDAPAIGENP